MNHDITENQESNDTIDCLESACAFMYSAIGRCIDYSKTSVGINLTPSKSSFPLLCALNGPIKWMNSMLPKDGRINIILNKININIEQNIITDKHWIEENLLCLLSNAVKYSSRGDINIKVTFKSKNNRIRISVEDSGIGISTESKLLLFKQFSKLQNMAIGSTGLGLYSLFKRSEALEGSCGMSDRKDGNRGSVFWFEFPYLACHDLNSQILSSGFSPKNLLILIVDDSATVVKCLGNKLTNQGHRVISVYNGSDAVDKMIELIGQIDVVFMDVQMPVMDGIEATKRYREVEKLYYHNLYDKNHKSCRAKNMQEKLNLNSNGNSPSNKNSNLNLNSNLNSNLNVDLNLNKLNCCDNKDDLKKINCLMQLSEVNDSSSNSNNNFNKNSNNMSSDIDDNKNNKNGTNGYNKHIINGYNHSDNDNCDSSNNDDQVMTVFSNINSNNDSYNSNNNKNNQNNDNNNGNNENSDHNIYNNIDNNLDNTYYLLNKLPIVCSSANSSGETEALAAAAGMDSFLSKPFTDSALASILAGIKGKNTIPV